MGRALRSQKSWAVDEQASRAGSLGPFCRCCGAAKGFFHALRFAALQCCTELIDTSDLDGRRRGSGCSKKRCAAGGLRK